MIDSNATPKAIQEILDNRERKLRGGYNVIPHGYKRLSAFMPGVQKSNYAIITANSGVGKSKFAKNMFVWRPYEFIRANPHLGIKFSCLYFCLEEPKTSFIQSQIAYKMRRDHNIRIAIKELRSQLEPDNPKAVLSVADTMLIEAMAPYLEDFEQHVHLIDNVHKPFEIFHACQEFLEEHGDYDMDLLPFWDKDAKRWDKKLQRGDFFTEHKDHYVLIVIDHISLLHREKGQTLHDAIRVLSNEHLVQLRNRYHCSILVVQQQASDKEKQQYTFKGASIESKLEPSLDGLGDCKLTQRDADEVYGLFAPDRYEITNHRGYDIERLRDNYRSFMFLKTRDSDANKRLAFFFDGASNILAELPPAKDMDDDKYDKVLKMAGRK